MVFLLFLCVKLSNCYYMREFVLSIVASLVASAISLGLSFVFSSVTVIVPLVLIGCCFLSFPIYLLIARKRSKNPYKHIRMSGVRIGIKPSTENVTCEGISILRPNYLKYVTNNGVHGIVHYSQVIFFV